MRMFIVVWKAYGEWKVTALPYPTKKDAQNHIDKRLVSSPANGDKSYITNIQIIPIDVAS